MANWTSSDRFVHLLGAIQTIEPVSKMLFVRSSSWWLGSSSPEITIPVSSPHGESHAAERRDILIAQGRSKVPGWVNFTTFVQKRCIALNNCHGADRTSRAEESEMETFANWYFYGQTLQK